MRDQSHMNLLCMLLYKVFTREEKNLIFRSYRQPPSTEEVKETVEEAAKQILRFFVEADSVDLDWVLRDEDATQGTFFENSTVFEEAIFSETYDRVERDAVEKASADGDFRALEKIISERGYLRTKRARDLITAKIRGESPARSVSMIDRNAASDIIKIMMQNKCSEYRAIQIAIAIDSEAEKNIELNENTLKSRLRRAKKDPIIRAKIAFAGGKIEEVLSIFETLRE